MIWSKVKLKNYIVDSIKQKNSLVPNDGNISNNLDYLVGIISEKICESHYTWQSETIIGNFLFNGGLCSDLIFLGPAIGNSSTNCFSKYINQSLLINNINSSFPNSYFYELTTQMKSLLNVICLGFIKTYNEWLQYLTFNNVLIQNGIVTCSILTPIGSFSGIANTDNLNSFIRLKINKQQFFENMEGFISSDLSLYNETNLSNQTKDLLNSFIEGILLMQEEWLNNTKLQNLQVNGSAIYLSPLINCIGQSGALF